MPKLKVGDTFIYTKEMNDEKVRSGDGLCFKEKIGRVVRIEAVSACGFYRTLGAGAPNFSTIDPFLPVANADERTEITWENLKKGDSVKSVSGSYVQTVIERLGDLVWISYDKQPNKCTGVAHHIDALKEWQMSIVQPKTKPEEMTEDEIIELVAKELKRNIKIKR